ncbi:unnamed protein product [Macrosiphum euphorbiae]|uniref:Uncharacterized protein n=1 Tax=Macrosiphum euphorbiae TaxID=13131 RepID=A0AAV0W6B7_9HEMI|nr:unnamed protein product [Macrosiphum euphorbiae]
MIFEVKSSIRSPVRCNRCLRFGHTQKYYRWGPRYSHCGETKHWIESCPYSQATDPALIESSLSSLLNIPNSNFPA